MRVGVYPHHSPAEAVPPVASWKVAPEVPILTAFALPTLRRGLAPMNLRPVLGVSKVGAS
jgi:hypothetical protein